MSTPKRHHLDRFANDFAEHIGSGDPDERLQLVKLHV
jgi:hypothetical protein